MASVCRVSAPGKNEVIKDSSMIALALPVVLGRGPLLKVIMKLFTGDWLVASYLVVVL